MKAKLISWIDQLEYLTTIAKTQPHAAYAAFTHGLCHRYVYIMRTVPEIADIIKPLDNAINNFLKVLLNGYNFNQDERDLLSLPPKFGGITDFHTARPGF